MTQIFLSTWGQNDNIGDSILRRGLLRSFQEMDGVELHVHVGRREPGESNDEGYLSALGLRGDEVLYDRTIDWLRGASTRVFAKRTIIVLPAGEIVYPKFGKRMVAAGNLLMALAPRVRGGTALQVGAGVRMSSVGEQAKAGTRRVSDVVAVPMLERVSRRAMAMVAWRDSATRRSFGVGDVLPDWAFGEGADPRLGGLGPAPAQRKLLAVTTRWDRGELTGDKIAQLHRLADRHDLTLQVYSQVRRDREHTVRLAQTLHPGTEPVLFEDQSHAEWEHQVRALHRQSAIVASDRAHALIIGATEGAVPVAISNWTTEKPVRTVRAGGISVPLDSDSSVESVETYVTAQLAEQTSIERPIINAREQIAEARIRMRAIVSKAESAL
ncbi:hypothetical protein HZU40_18840 [Mycolicibacterium fluoranthenivorans]|uniref:Polysaccharide pyruvyl transferase family protein n=1 Tax=Mycolicibacterium fluoranthenivorans TaxID=258505 RepID=A0A1G4WCX6_9MYCO|nr:MULTISPECIES: hypothetical protein [Mycobacteriaceae]MCV7256521.1 hypothetical protein [Mycobacterium hackensackense]QNJ90338.1 hypothetical protein HZU40_18840 [Mycolicibacterium fluoranthenivorans]SCX20532.1 hypothetical protein SAMN02799620_02923 [Mycolicibacterium fluoranthenivorans]